MLMAISFSRMLLVLGIGHASSEDLHARLPDCRIANESIAISYFVQLMTPMG